MEEGCILDVAYMCDEGADCDVFLLQEGPKAESASERILENGHMLFSSPEAHTKRSVGMLLHRRWVLKGVKTRFRAPSATLAYLDVTSHDSNLTLRIVSSHLRHGGYEDEDYEEGLRDLETVILDARAQGRRVVLGADANAILGRQLPFDDVEVIGQHGHGERNARGHAPSHWLHGVRLVAAASLHGKPWEESWTHKLWSTGEERQVDYIVVDCLYADTVWDVGIYRELEDKSDHRALWATFTYEASATQRARRQRFMRGWAPDIDDVGIPTKFHELLTIGLEEGHASVVDVNGIIVTAATASSDVIEKIPQKHSDSIKQLFSERGGRRARRSKRLLSMRLWSELRKQRRQRRGSEIEELAEHGRGIWSLQRAQQRQSGIERVAAINNAKGELISDSAVVADIFAQFYEDLYNEHDADRTGQEDHLAGIVPPVSKDELSAALKRMKKGPYSC